MAERETEVRLELLLGKRFVDANGEPIGRLEEVVADEEVGANGSTYAIRELHLGSFAALERLAGGPLRSSFLRLLGRGRFYRLYAVSWRDVDLSDTDHPRVRRPKAELSALRPG